MPIPADTIIGLYHPFRDLYAKNYPNGIPFKNFLITDPVRQQYPWKELVISIEKKFSLPLWNPYSFSGTPLLSNFQSASFYPLNVLFFILPFSLSFILLIFLQPLLGGVFLYLFLDNLKLSKWASLLGGITFSFCGFSIAWMEWGTVLHVGLWLPLILLAIDKIFLYSEKISNNKYQIVDIHIKNRKLVTWGLLFIFSLCSSFFAGHLQIFFYLFLFSIAYIFARWVQFGKETKFLVRFFIFYFLFFMLTVIQWLPTLQFISLSARGVDQVSFNNPGWFVPWQHLIQFIAPDFFGNPTTLNYWGVWNYAELVGYVGIIPLLLAFFSLLFRRDKKTLFFGAMLFWSLLFALPTFFAQIPYLWKIPFVDTAQPTRLLFITTFSLSVLSALGFDHFIRLKRKMLIFYPLIFMSFIFLCLWFLIPVEHASVVKSNLTLPTLLFFSSIAVFFVLNFSGKRFTLIIYIIIVGITIFDLFRFGWKFTPFTNSSYLFPKTEALSFLQKHSGHFRIMTTDSRILPPNFSIMYKLQSVDGYDPLYLRRYGELIAASERSSPRIDPPFGFNRIITPHNYDSRIMDLLGVKYVLSFSDLQSQKFVKVFQEGQTRVYENKNAMPRVFFVEKIRNASDKNESIRVMFDKNFDLRTTAVVEDSRGVISVTPPRCTKCEIGAKVANYSENKVVVKTENDRNGFLVLTDSFYPTWHAKIDDKETKIFITDYNLRGVAVPKGKHQVLFYNSLL